MAITAKLTIGKTPVQGPNMPPGKGESLTVQSDPKNAALVYLADCKDVEANGYALEPGRELPLRVTNASGLWFVSEAGQQVIRFLVN